MPVRDEADHLEAAVAAVRAQDYPGRVEMCLAVAPSTDGTERDRECARRAHDDVTVVDNPAGTTPAGLNAAIRATDGEVIVRVDGHAELSPGYIRRAVETLRRTGAVNVGGIQRAEGVTPFEQAVAAAMTSRFGTGDAKFHYGGVEGPTDTVYLGVFDRAAIEAVGLFDETLVRNQDYELNIRLRASRRDGVVRPRAVGALPTAGVAARPRPPVLRVRPVEARGPPPSPRLAALAASRYRRSRPARQWSVSLPRRGRRPRSCCPVCTSPQWASPRSAPVGGQPSLVGRLLAIFPTIHFSWSAGLVTHVGRFRRRFSGCD